MSGSRETIHSGLEQSKISKSSQINLILGEPLPIKSFFQMGIIFYLAIVTSGLIAAYAINKILKAVKLI